MATLTTPSRVYHKSGLSVNDIAPTEIDEIIEDAQAFIEGKAARIFVISDIDYNLARSACTDLAAAYSLIHLLGGEYSGLSSREANLGINAQQDTKVALIKQYLNQVKEVVDILKPKISSLRPKASTS